MFSSTAELSAIIRLWTLGLHKVGYVNSLEERKLPGSDQGIDLVGFFGIAFGPWKTRSWSTAPALLRMLRVDRSGRRRNLCNCCEGTFVRPETLPGAGVSIPHDGARSIVSVSITLTAFSINQSRVPVAGTDGKKGGPIQRLVNGQHGNAFEWSRQLPAPAVPLRELTWPALRNPAMVLRKAAGSLPLLWARTSGVYSLSR